MKRMMTEASFIIHFLRSETSTASLGLFLVVFNNKLDSIARNKTSSEQPLFHFSGAVSIARRSVFDSVSISAAIR
jgi:hypothetical protein